MSDTINSEGKSPDQFTKRAATPTNSAAVGFGTSSLGLLALYINECLTAGQLVVPSTEMIIVIAGLLLPGVHLVWRVGAKKLRDWAESQGIRDGE